MDRQPARLWILGFLFPSVIAMAGCGGQPVGTASAAGFINHTQHSSAQLSALWSAAQQILSHHIDLNPLQRELYNAAPNILPGDARALGVSPHQLQVEIASRRFISGPAAGNRDGAPRSHRTDRLSSTVQHALCASYAPAYSHYAQPATRYAASWESSESNFDALVRYEFENQILHSLGYDTTWR